MKNTSFSTHELRQKSESIFSLYVLKLEAIYATKYRVELWYPESAYFHLSGMVYVLPSLETVSDITADWKRRIFLIIRTGLLR